jgi:hypothetical protein
MRKNLDIYGNVLSSDFMPKDTTGNILPGFSSGKGFGRFSLTGVDAQADYPVPAEYIADVDMDKAIIALNPIEVEAILIMVEEVPTIRFTTPPATGDYPTIIYNKL